MAEPLTWAKPGEPGPAWDSGETWDGVKAATTKRKPMNTKAIIDFSGDPAAELGNTAQTIHDKLLANAAVFTGPPPRGPAGIPDAARRLSSEAPRPCEQCHG